MAFGQDLLKGFFGNQSLRDFSHASKAFLANGYEFIPRNKFLFHVFFNINVSIPNLSQVFKPDLANLGLLVKSVQLPTYTINVDTLNSYNRKKNVQTKMEYGPVTIEMHDDQADLVRTMWYNYFSYYYKDPTQPYAGIPVTDGTSGASPLVTNGSSYAVDDTYAPTRASNDWGYIGEGYSDASGSGLSQPGSTKPPFFRDIRIFGMSQKKFAAYVLINPMITKWDHDTYSYSEGGGATMKHTMGIKYETVKYYSGAVGPSSVLGFAQPGSYDKQPSPLARPGSTRSIFGQGGLLDAGLGIIDDLQKGSVLGVLGAVQQAGRTWETFKGANAKAVLTQTAIDGVKAMAQDARTSVNNTGVLIPTPYREVADLTLGKLGKK